MRQSTVCRVTKGESLHVDGLHQGHQGGCIAIGSPQHGGRAVLQPIMGPLHPKHLMYHYARMPHFHQHIAVLPGVLGQGRQPLLLVQGRASVTAFYMFRHES